MMEGQDTKREGGDGDRQQAPRFTGLASFYRASYRPDPASWKDVQIGLVGVPFDGGTTNRPGARHGPRALREASTMIAPWNAGTDVNPFGLCRIADVGDAWAPHPFDLEVALKEIEQFYQTLVSCGVVPVSAGGDHSVSLPILRAVGKNSPVGMVHIDAHADTGSGFMGSKYHHGAPFARAVEEGVLDPARTIQVGIRGPLNHKDIWKFSRDSGMRIIPIEECISRGIPSVIREARQLVGDAPCYLSFDIDALDPAFAPGTGTPVIGGFSSREAIQFVRGLTGLNFVGADLVEVSPPFDVGGTTALAGATLMFEILCIVAGRMATTPREISHD